MSYFVNAGLLNSLAENPGTVPIEQVIGIASVRFHPLPAQVARQNHTSLQIHG